MGRPHRREILWKYLTTLVERTFPISVESFLHSTLLSSLGVNSLNAFGLSNELKRDTGITIPATRLISEDLTLQKLLDEIDAGITNQEVHFNGFVTRNNEDIYRKLSKHISPMQEFIYRNYQANYKNNDVLQVTELKLPTPLGINGLKSILYKLIKRHQELRTLYKLTDNGIIPNVLENFEIPKIVVVQSTDQKHVKGEIQRIYEQPFDLHSELPFRIVFNPSEQLPRIWFIFHPISFDQKAINLFFKEFKGLAMNDDMASIEEVNIPGETFKVLIPQFHELGHFWKARFNKNTQIAFLSLTESSKVDHIPSALEDKVQREIHPDLVRQVSETCKELNITVFHFLVCTFQLFWHLLTGENKIGLLIDVDTRQHVPALMNVITHCSNNLPVTGLFQEGSTIQSCLQSTSSEVKDCVRHALYPGFLVLQNLSHEASTNVCRHKIVMEDLTDQLDLSGNAATEVGQAGPMGIHHETRLLLWTSVKHNILKLQLDYHPGIMTQKAAELCLSDLEALVCFMATNSSSLIRSIPLSLLHSSARSVVLPSYSNRESAKPFDEQSFEKYKPSLPHPHSPYHTEKPDVTEVEPQRIAGSLDHASTIHQGDSPIASVSNHTDTMTLPDSDLSSLNRGSWLVKKSGFGCCLTTWHEVILHVSYKDEKPDYLLWGIDENCPVEKVSIGQIKKVNLHSARGRYALKIKTSNKTTIFRTENQAEATSWTAALNQLVNDRDQAVCYENKGSSFEEESRVIVN